MSCPGCERTVSKVIEKHGGMVEMVSAKEGRAVFTVSGPEAIDDIVRGIEEKGYRVRDLRKESS